MKKEAAKIFKKYGDKIVMLVKNYKPASNQSKTTTAIKGSRMDVNKAIGTIMLKADKDERKIIGAVLTGDYFEDWDSENRMVIKY